MTHDPVGVVVDLHLLTRQVTAWLTEVSGRRILRTDTIGVPEEGIDRLASAATTLRLATTLAGGSLTYDTMTWSDTARPSHRSEEHRTPVHTGAYLQSSCSGYPSQLRY